MSADGPPASGSYLQQQGASLIGEVIDGRYRMIRKLGEGGMGEVYAAEHVHIEKRFAVKLLRPEIVSNAEAVSRFRQEARSASSIGHRNIIGIEDFGQLPDGRIYMCMELLAGAALNDLIAQPQPVDRLLNIIIQSGHGLAAAHAKGIIHRDMKPENIYVTVGPNNEDIPKLLDFGIAKVSGNDGQNNLTRTGTIFGTPFYMAPEQALGNPVDARTDVYAMGVIMYEIFAGSLPFQGESFMGILTQHITTEPEPVAQRAAKAQRQLPPGLADVITRSMQKDPQRRFQTMDELVNALIQIYRGFAGAGMSTYMEAFPVAPSGHHSTPTPPPMTGPVVVPHGHSATIAVHGPPLHTPPAGQHAISSSASGLYDPNASVANIPKKSKLGLILALVAVLAVAGGIVAVVLLSNKKDADALVAKGSGSDGSDDDDDGSDGSAGGIIPDNGSDVVPDKRLDAGGDVAIDAAATTPEDAGSATVDPPEIDAGVASPPQIDAGVLAPTQVVVLLKLKSGGAFTVWENGRQILVGPGNLKVVPGEQRLVTLKAKNFKDKMIMLDGKLEQLVVKLDREKVVIPDRPDPPKMDCTNRVVDPKSESCRRQNCAKHPDLPVCLTE
ncbi:MAG: serine/threonine-protein kinase [Kofleriaceae bacterium]